MRVGLVGDAIERLAADALGALLPRAPGAGGLYAQLLALAAMALGFAAGGSLGRRRLAAPLGAADRRALELLGLGGLALALGLVLAGGELALGIGRRVVGSGLGGVLEAIVVISTVLHG